MKQFLLLSLFIIASIHTINAMEEIVDKSQEELNKQLIIAATRGSLKEVKKWVNQGADPNAYMQIPYFHKDNYGHPLQGWNNQTDLMRHTLDSNPLLSAGGRDPWFDPGYISKWDQRKMVRFLLKADADPTKARDEGNNNLLHYVCRPLPFALLLEHELNVNQQNSSKTTPLHSAVWYHKTDLVKLYLEHGAHIGIQNHKNETVFHCTVGTSSHLLVDITKQLLYAVLFRNTEEETLTKQALVATFCALKRNKGAYSYFYQEHYKLLLPYLKDQLPLQALMRMLKAQNIYVKPFALQAIPKQLSTRGQALKKLLQVKNKSGLTAHSIHTNSHILGKATESQLRLVDPQAVEPDMYQFITALKRGTLKTVPNNNIFKAAYEKRPQKSFWESCVIC